jgi:hypothetical protein
VKVVRTGLLATLAAMAVNVSSPPWRAASVGVDFETRGLRR